MMPLNIQSSPLIVLISLLATPTFCEEKTALPPTLDPEIIVSCPKYETFPQPEGPPNKYWDFAFEGYRFYPFQEMDERVKRKLVKDLGSFLNMNDHWIGLDVTCRAGSASNSSGNYSKEQVNQVTDRTELIRMTRLVLTRAIESWTRNDSKECLKDHLNEDDLSNGDLWRKNQEWPKKCPRFDTLHISPEQQQPEQNESFTPLIVITVVLVAINFVVIFLFLFVLKVLHGQQVGLDGRQRL